MPYTHLAQEERFLIYKRLQAGDSRRTIAEDLGRSHSTVIREIKRNTGKRGYRHKQAEESAKRRRSEASSVPRKMSEALWATVEELVIQQRWSPEQIAGRLRLDAVVSVSAKWIYNHIWEDRRAGGELYRYLRRRGKRANRRGKGGWGRGVIPGRVDISNRPKEAEHKSRVGDWEVDTITGSRHRGALVSLVDRCSKFTFLRKIDTKTAQEAGEAILGCLGGVKELVHTITADNGKEFAGHSRVSEELGAGFYFATPYHSWERGLNEHTNGLVREFFPKSQDLRKVDAEDVRRVEELLNNRPRKALGYETPAEVFNEALGENSIISELCSLRE